MIHTIANYIDTSLSEAGELLEFANSEIDLFRTMAAELKTTLIHILDFGGAFTSGMRDKL